MKTRYAVLLGAVLFSSQLYGGPLVGQWTLNGGKWEQIAYSPKESFLIVSGPNYALEGKMFKRIEVDKGVFEYTYSGLLYLYSEGPWVGCVPPPEVQGRRYFKAWFPALTMRVMPKEPGIPDSKIIILKGEAAPVMFVAPGFQAWINATGGGTMSSSGAGKGFIDSTTIMITGPIVDIKPDSEHNPVNVNSRGVIPVAVYGADPALYQNPIAFSLAGAETRGFDFAEGILTLKFDTQQVVGNLWAVEDGQVLDVPLFYGSQAVGCDSITVIKKGQQ